MRYNLSSARLARLLCGTGLGLVLVAGGAPAFAADAAAAAAAAETGPVHIDPETPDFGRQVSELVVTGASAAVTAAPTKTPLEATEPKSIIDRKAIDQFIPTTADYTQIVNLSPSVSGTSTNGPGLGESKSVIRGFQDGQYNVTYDGIAFGDANDTTHHPAAFFPSSTIGAAVVDRGPGAAGDLGQANFGGAVHLFSPTVSDVMGASQKITYGSFNTQSYVTTLQTGAIGPLRGAKLLLNFDERLSDGELSYAKG
ncbi:TonB-dependent receptor plug domain-containing protein, partial [Phenylobacterium sp.]|uniref:TonB-dependent receptor plug domain-containing protein n=1 Tax=Phenylobacterium sp. TaxID=1871053 RepID=UPI002E365060